MFKLNQSNKWAYLAIQRKKKELSADLKLFKAPTEPLIQYGDTNPYPPCKNSLKQL